MPKSKYITGFEDQPFGQTTAKSYSHSVRHVTPSGKSEYHHYWRFECACGKHHVSDIRSAVRGMVQSCGCGMPIATAKRFLQHGHAVGRTTSREFNSWKKMKSRVLNPNHIKAKHYIGRGIKFCKGLAKFPDFLRILGERPPDTSLDRIDNDGNYSCGKCSECVENGWRLNVRWADRETQVNNTRKTIRITHNGKTQGLAQWCRELGLPYKKMLYRIRHCSFEEAKETCLN